MLKQGAGVVTSRNHVRFVVTEYGVADLYGKSIRQRATQLIGIAHPDFRAELEKQAKRIALSISLSRSDESASFLAMTSNDSNSPQGVVFLPAVSLFY
jgi:acyl-CoA hydrolase